MKYGVWKAINTCELIAQKEMRVKLFGPTRLERLKGRE
jgi:hypothetical protein